MNTMTQLQKRVGYIGKEQPPMQPSFMIKSGKDTIDLKGDHIPKEYIGNGNG